VSDEHVGELEVFNKPWYSTPKEKAKKLGILHKATLKSND
jgi:hypothetical protein